jgi:hypothetical protein
VLERIRAIFGRRARRLPLEGRAGIDRLGHRRYVGGHWDEIGALQFEFLVAQGLRPEHTLLDVACGALRGGVHFIRHLEPGHYLGIDKEQSLIDAGVELELGAELLAAKAPELVVSDRFDFSGFSKCPDMSIAQSLFTHLALDDVELCLRNLRAFVAPGHLFFATFSEGEPERNPDASHSRKIFRYSRGQLEALGHENGWRPTYIGSWNHPRDQKMMRFEAV